MSLTSTYPKYMLIKIKYIETYCGRVSICLIAAIFNGVLFHLIAYDKALKYAIKQRNYAVKLYASEHSDLYRGLQLYLLFSVSEAEHESSRGSHGGKHFPNQQEQNLQ
jgi:hypothetical protein